ncbi:FadR/GntR family transcriptional regulator [Parapusillimonas granuli]|uniref:FadR family transcriptional regulator n=1 Tax=Parapusillimonas granuli TaxID=380911 RepID=A0A853FXR6_9BURK|nr:FadR/GntR family transcriptional regulator [Parapusillimonas granuli]MBB5215887.1 DNA-binding FadR family transcriptional regulator [Parapusillimonas granuli]MEB2399422.1 FadR/GntR family transcriptional regulator [Alcaligenaceae bacterium]NYT50815.1 FadR family transcriptional regulator [Parapusillimonas granuli]
MSTTAKHATKKKALSAQVADELRSQIQGGRYAPGDKLPTESTLVQQFGHSRTVIREAVAALRADGLLESRQGAGVFVLAPPEQPELLMLLTHATDKISDIIEELELRIGVEVEAAGLAAQRRSPAQEAEIQAQLDRYAQLAKENQPTDEADFCFHMAIAAATNNARFKTFLEHIGRRMIPRVRFRAVTGGIDLPSRDDTILAEHAAIAAAISAGDAHGAREAMRMHLQIGLQRYRAMTRAIAAAERR